MLASMHPSSAGASAKIAASGVLGLEENAMLKMNLMTWLSVCLMGMLVTAGCSNDSSDGPSGALDLNLELAGSAQIDEVLYQISGNGMPPMGGIIDTSAPGATASVEVFGLPEGGDYLIELRAVANGGTVCAGSAGFSVRANRATPVAVMLNCKAEQRLGSVRVNGKLNVCAELTKVVVSPLETSVGSLIELSMEGRDAEGDPLRYLWLASDGPISNPSSPRSVYGCQTAGAKFIEASVSDERGCIDSWVVEVRCVDGDGGTGGSGGAPMCMARAPTCRNGQIDPVIEDPTCMLSEPPVLADGCVGAESLINPASCTATGNETIHQVQLIAIDGDCNSGFDLDSCAGESCRVGGLSPGEGVDGVDNALAGLAPILAGVDANLGGVDQVLYDGLCDGSISWTFALDPNPEENCVSVTPVYGGVPASAIPMNLNETGCISGRLGTIPIPIAGVRGQLDNALIRGTADGAQGFNMTLAATADDETAIAIAESLLEGGGAVVEQVFDIRSDLEGDLTSRCDALSLTLDVGATLVGGTAQAACTDASNAMVYANLEFTDSRGNVFIGAEAAAAIGNSCVRGSVSSIPPIEGCGTETFGVIACFPNCPATTINALADCVAGCTQDTTAELSPPGLTDACVACSGDDVACNVALCTSACIVDTTAPACINCRCDNGCTQELDRCSGLPPSGECE